MGYVFEDRYVSLNELNVDYSYQRKLSNDRVRKIVRDFDEALVRPIIVSERVGGDKFIVDGNHTAHALTDIFGGKRRALCRVYRGLTVEDEAALFSRLNSSGKKPSFNERLKSDYRAGKKEATDYVDALIESGVPYVIGNSGRNMRQMICHSLGITLLKKCGKDVFIRGLKVVDDSWKSYNTAFNNQTVGGVVLFLNTFPNVDDEKLKFSLSKITPENVFAGGKAFGNSCSSGLATSKANAMYIATVYNKGRRNNRVDPSKILSD